MNRAVLALAFALSCTMYGSSARGETSGASGSADPCSPLTRDEAASLLGYPVSDPDELSRRGGSCFYYSRSASEDGTLAYRVVRDASMPSVRQTFAAAAITCNGVNPLAPRFAECEIYRKLAAVPNPKAYCSVRTTAPDAEPAEGGPENAIFASGSLFVMRGDACFEARVLHGDQPQAETEMRLLEVLLSRGK